MSAITDDIVAGDIPPAVTPRPLTPEQRGALAILGSYIKTMRNNGDHATADLLQQVCMVIEDGQAADAAALVQAWREGQAEPQAVPRDGRDGIDGKPLCPDCHKPISVVKTLNSPTYHAHCFGIGCHYQSKWMPTVGGAWVAWRADWDKSHPATEPTP